MKTPRYLLSREEYDELFVNASQARWYETDPRTGKFTRPVDDALPPRTGELARPEFDAMYPPPAYPKGTSAVVGELRTRGFDVQLAPFDQLIRRGTVPGPLRNSGEGRNRQWSADDVDRAAEALIDISYPITPSAAAARVHGYSLADEIRSQRRAFEANPDLPADPDMFVVEIIPGALGVGVLAKINHRRMTRAEESDRRARIHAQRDESDTNPD